MEKLKNIKNGQLHKHYAKIKNYLVIKDKDKARDFWSSIFNSRAMDIRAKVIYNRIYVCNDTNII